MYMYNMYNDSINRCLPIPKEAAKEKRRLQWIRLQKVAIRRCTGFWWIYIYVYILYYYNLGLLCPLFGWKGCILRNHGKPIYKPYIPGRWFGTWLDFFHSVGNVIILTDELIFFRGVAQPPTSYIYILCIIGPKGCTSLKPQDRKSKN